MRIIKTAKASDKIHGWGITNPHLMFFIYAYENEIDWGMVKNEKDIMQFIETNLMPKIHQKIDPESQNNNYFKDISDEGLNAQFQAYPHDEKIQAIAQTYKIDKETAKSQFLRLVNDKKSFQYFDWWNFFRQENPTYKENPAFSYCMLRKIFDSSPETKKETVSVLDPNIVQTIYNRIKEKPTDQINIEKTYSRELVSKNTSGMEITNAKKNEGWLYIPRKSADPTNFDSNVKKLSELSQGHGWCIGYASTAENYLTQGDFHLFVQNDVCKVVVRLIGDKQIYEVRKEHNYPAVEYWEEVLGYVRGKGLITDKGPQSSGYFDRPCIHLEEAEKTNVQLRDDPNYAEQFKKILKSDLNKYDQLSKENKIKFAPDVASVWSDIIKRNYENYQTGYDADLLLTFFDKCPPAAINILQRQEPDKIAMVMDFWIKSIIKNPSTMLEKIPASVKRRLPVGFENNIWDGYLKNIIETGNTYSIRNEYSKLNDNIRQQLSGDIKQKVAKAWITHLGHNKESYKELNQCPQDIRNLMTPEDLQIPRQRIIGMIDNDPSYYNRDMPADIFQHLPPETRQKVRLHWAQQIYTLPKRFESCPDEIRKTFKEGFEMTAWDRYITESIKRGEERVYGGGQETDKWVPRHVRERLSPNTITIITQFYERHAIESPTRVVLDTPNEVLQKFSDDACKKIAEKLTPYIADYPDFINDLPEKITNHFQHDVETDIWRSKISEDPRQIENAPERVKQKIPEQFVVQAWIRAITNNIHTYNNCPEKYLEQIPMVWRVNIWSRHLRANYLDYKKCPQNIKTQINESTKNIIARALATEIKKTPLNKDYYMEQFNTIWPADSEILMLLPDDVKNKLRRADIPFVRAALGPLQPIQPLRNETR